MPKVKQIHVMVLHFCTMCNELFLFRAKKMPKRGTAVSKERSMDGFSELPAADVFRAGLALETLARVGRLYVLDRGPPRTLVEENIFAAQGVLLA